MGLSGTARRWRFEIGTSRELCLERQEHYPSTGTWIYAGRWWDKGEMVVFLKQTQIRIERRANVLRLKMKRSAAERRRNYLVAGKSRQGATEEEAEKKQRVFMFRSRMWSHSSAPGPHRVLNPRLFCLTVVSECVTCMCDHMCASSWVCESMCACGQGEKIAPYCCPFWLSLTCTTSRIRELIFHSSRLQIFNSPNQIFSD